MERLVWIEPCEEGWASWFDVLAILMGLGRDKTEGDIEHLAAPVQLRPAPHLSKV